MEREEATVTAQVEAPLHLHLILALELARADFGLHVTPTARGIAHLDPPRAARTRTSKYTRITTHVNTSMRAHALSSERCHVGAPARSNACCPRMRARARTGAAHSCSVSSVGSCFTSSLTRALPRSDSSAGGSIFTFTAPAACARRAEAEGAREHARVGRVRFDPSQPVPGGAVRHTCAVRRFFTVSGVEACSSWPALSSAPSAPLSRFTPARVLPMGRCQALPAAI